MTRFIAALTASLLFCSAATAAVTVRYYNKDSKEHVAEAVCSGSKKVVKFGSSRTASVTIQGSGPCKVTLGNTVELKGGEKITIKGGQISID